MSDGYENYSAKELAALHMVDLARLVEDKKVKEAHPIIASGREAMLAYLKDPNSTIDKAEYDWLLWFKHNADFGPADGDVQMYMQQQYEKETGNKIPAGWRYDEDGEEDEEEDDDDDNEEE